MNINFTGFKNIGYVHRQFITNNNIENLDNDNNDEIEEAQNYDEQFLTVQLTDDYNGKDLTEFKKAISTSDLPRNKLNPIGNDFLNILITKEGYKNDLIKDSEINFYINDEELKINDKNLKFISYITKLLKRISQTPESEIIHIKDFVNGEDADNAICLGENLMDMFGANYYTVKKSIYSQEYALHGSKCMFNDYQNTMTNYFA